MLHPSWPGRPCRRPWRRSSPPRWSCASSGPRRRATGAAAGPGYLFPARSLSRGCARRWSCWPRRRRSAAVISANAPACWCNSGDRFASQLLLGLVALHEFATYAAHHGAGRAGGACDVAVTAGGRARASRPCGCPGPRAAAAAAARLGHAPAGGRTGARIGRKHLAFDPGGVRCDTMALVRGEAEAV